MYKKIPVKINATESCTIFVGAGILGDLSKIFDFEPYSSVVLIADRATEKLYAQRVIEALKLARKSVLVFAVPRGENSKSLAEVERVYRFLMNNKVDRKALICALGGGVVGDLAGYIAATYLRGIDYIQIPTTLLAQVDSSIGGKVGVNFGGKKNIIGSFYQPRAVISDVALLESLPLEEMRNGIAEVIKYGVAMDKELFQKISRKGDAEFAISELVEIVARCSSLKARVVEADETERSGQRAILNFGHTIGHAIEAAGNLRGQRHGEAVAIGMVAAARISVRIGMLHNRSVQRIEKVLTRFGLPTRCSETTPAELIKAIHFDKKVARGQVRWVLLAEIGRGVVNNIVADDIVKEVLKEMCR
ncbi:MAG: 3-dehydroquinate synthase [Chloroflexi bacterium]|nr:3-dehydroquinate synthase [Chloroflexota bacterium]